MLYIGILAAGFILGFLSSRKNWKIRRLKDKNKTEASYHYLNALNFMIEQNIDSALLELKHVVSLDTDHIEAYLKLGDLYRKKGQYDKAIKIHEGITLRQIIPKDILIKTHISLLKDLIMVKNTDKIKTSVNKLMSLGNKDLGLNITLKNILKRLNMWEEIYEIQKRIIKQQNSTDKKELAYIISRIGDQLLHKGASKEAWKKYKEAIDLDELCTNASIGLGDIYYKQHKNQQAIEEWKKVVVYDPSSLVKIYKKLEAAYFEEQEFEKMISLYEEILSKSPNIPEINLALGEIYEKMGQKDRAISLYLEAIRIKGDLGEAYKNLFLLYQKNGKKEEAQAIFEKIENIFIKNKN